MIEENVTEVAAIEAPYGKQIVMQNVAYENGTRILRMRIREGNRFTVMDLSQDTVSQLSNVLSSWKEEGNQ